MLPGQHSQLCEDDEDEEQHRTGDIRCEHAIPLLAILEIRKCFDEKSKANQL